MFGPWTTFNSIVFYLTLVLSLGGLAGNGLVLRTLGFHVKKGPLSVYVLHLASADCLFLASQAGFSVAEATLGSQHPLALPLTFLWFAVGLWLLAALGTEHCLSSICPACYQCCRPKHASAALCVLIWALSLPAVLLPAHACGLLGHGRRLRACLRYHAAGLTWLACLTATACVPGLVLLAWVGCCSPRPRPHLDSVVLGTVLLFILCGLPFVLYWSFTTPLNFLLPMFGPLATLLACVDSGAKPLLYFMAGRQRGKREPLRATLQRALGGKAEREAAGLTLPLGLM
ncbi:mas-related G-protein coupled receptor member G [Choloepus didactylus]|uniref:mas-related G-protein coupled receptor member G n=1 Tax=Choloepus didactylus TaxID=27675 RepID=UPI00189D0FF9|nr:mas-related G-protein coupled receptor member G [Choloepus didactylus]